MTFWDENNLRSFQTIQFNSILYFFTQMVYILHELHVDKHILNLYMWTNISYSKIYDFVGKIHFCFFGAMDRRVEIRAGFGTGSCFENTETLKGHRRNLSKQTFWRLRKVLPHVFSKWSQTAEPLILVVGPDHFPDQRHLDNKESLRGHCLPNARRNAPNGGTGLRLQ